MLNNPDLLECIQKNPFNTYSWNWTTTVYRLILLGVLCVVDPLVVVAVEVALPAKFVTGWDGFIENCMGDDETCRLNGEWPGVKLSLLTAEIAALVAADTRDKSCCGRLIPEPKENDPGGLVPADPVFTVGGLPGALGYKITKADITPVKTWEKGSYKIETKRLVSLCQD